MGSGGWGGGGGSGGGEDSFSLVFENSIVLIKCTLYDTVFQRQVSICRGVVFSYSFSIYCAAYHGIWCSDDKECKPYREGRAKGRCEDEFDDILIKYAELCNKEFPY